MQLKKTMLLIVVAQLAALFAPFAAHADCNRLRLANDRLLIQNGTSTVAVSDSEGIEMPRWSPRGDQIIYVRRFNYERAAYSTLVVIDNAGRMIRSFPIPADSAVNAIVQLGWRDDDHVFVEGHVNPSTTQYLEWEVATGRLITQKAGSWFAVSPDGRFVAQRAHVPHGAPPPYDSAMLVINDEVVYPVAGDEAYRRFIGAPSWSPDSTQVALLEGGDESAILVLFAPDTKRVLRFPLAGVAVPRELSWSGTNTLLIRTSRGDVWQADRAGGRLSVAPASAPAASAYRLQPQAASTPVLEERCSPD